MKTKKLVISLLFVVIAVTSMVGCTTKTEYDDRQVVKIETQMHNGEGFVGYRMRLFNFESGTVMDKAVVSDIEFSYLLELYVYCPSDYSEYKSIEQYREYLLSCYNVPILVAEFSQEDCIGFVSAAQSFGIYTWQDNYIDNSICDATNQYVIITFADGTSKTTRCYNKYPQDFEKVETAFKDYFNVGAWCELRLK